MIRSAVLQGLTALPVEIQVGLQPGDNFRIVGLGKGAIKEAKARLQHAINSSRLNWPVADITINPAPADVPKEGTSLDLALALALLHKDGQISGELREGTYAIGELNLDGTLRRCPGALAIARELPDGSTLIAPKENAPELALLRGLKGAGKPFHPLIAATLREAVEQVVGRNTNEPKASAKDFRPAFLQGTDFAKVKGQVRAKRACEVAAAGGHNLLLVGPPGEGKSLLAKALPTILPTLTNQEILELTQIWSAKGLLGGSNEIVLHRPFRPVHRSASQAAIVGGGSGYPEPGEISHWPIAACSSWTNSLISPQVCSRPFASPWRTESFTSHAGTERRPFHANSFLSRP